MGSSSLAWVIDQWVGSCVVGHHMGSFASASFFVGSQRWGHLTPNSKQFELFCLQLSFFAYSGKARLRSTSTDCKHRSSTVGKKARAVSKKASAIIIGPMANSPTPLYVGWMAVWFCVSIGIGLKIRYSWSPCDRDPPTEIFHKLWILQKFLKKYLTFTFGEIAFTFGDITFTFGEIMFTFGETPKMLGFLEFNFCCWRGFGTLWVGGPRRGFRNFLQLLWPFVGNSIHSSDD